MGKFGPKATKILWSGAVSKAVGATHPQTLYSDSFDLSYGSNFAILLKAAGTTVNLKVEVEQGIVRPTTEGSADTTNYAIPSGASSVTDALVDTNLYIKAFSPVTTQFGRLKVTTLGAGSANQVLEAWISKLEDM